MTKQILCAAAIVAAAGASASANAIITGIMDGDLSGGAPKAIELYVDGTVDFTGWSLDRASNGGSFGTTSDLSGLGVVSDSFVYLVGSAGAGVTDFEALFGTSGDFANTFAIGVVQGNGNDAFQLLDAGLNVVDGFGDPADVSGSGDYSAPWAYLDSWAYRADFTGPDGGFSLGNWGFGGNGALDGLDAAQQGAAVPFGTYQVPAPGVAGALALGGLAASRRRRA